STHLPHCPIFSPPHFLIISLPSTLLFFFFYSYGAHRDLHSFPTRRLFRSRLVQRRRQVAPQLVQRRHRHESPVGVVEGKAVEVRSEEHTSELQSLAYLVCRLLLEKKKKKQMKTISAKKKRHTAQMITTHGH